MNMVMKLEKVAPHGGAWIEIHVLSFAVLFLGVAPHGGAWIEIAL